MWANTEDTGNEELCPAYILLDVRNTSSTINWEIMTETLKRKSVSPYLRQTLPSYLEDDRSLYAKREHCWSSRGLGSQTDPLECMLRWHIIAARPAEGGWNCGVRWFPLRAMGSTLNKWSTDWVSQIFYHKRNIRAIGIKLLIQDLE